MIGESSRAWSENVTTPIDTFGGTARTRPMAAATDSARGSPATLCEVSMGRTTSIIRPDWTRGRTERISTGDPFSLIAMLEAETLPGRETVTPTVGNALGWISRM